MSERLPHQHAVQAGTDYRPDHRDFCTIHDHRSAVQATPGIGSRHTGLSTSRGADESAHVLSALVPIRDGQDAPNRVLDEHRAFEQLGERRDDPAQAMPGQHDPHQRVVDVLRALAVPQQDLLLGDLRIPLLPQLGCSNRRGGEPRESAHEVDL
jgi:hypothetical protein